VESYCEFHHTAVSSANCMFLETFLLFATISQHVSRINKEMPNTNCKRNQDRKTRVEKLTVKKKRYVCFLDYTWFSVSKALMRVSMNSTTRSSL